MTPQFWDAIAAACERIEERSRRATHPSALDRKAAGKADRLTRSLRPVRRRRSVADPVGVMRSRCIDLATRLRRIARDCAARIDAGRAKPTTTGPVGDAAATEAQLARWEQQRLDGLRGRVLRGMRS